MNILAVAVGGFFGAILRYGIGILLPHEQGFPISTFLVNSIGCFVLAFFLTIFAVRAKLHEWLQVAIGAGFIGSFTTFSTFSVESLRLFEQHQYLEGISYVCLSVIVGVTFAWIGMWLAQCLKKRSFR